MDRRGELWIGRDDGYDANETTEMRPRDRECTAMQAEAVDGMMVEGEGDRLTTETEAVAGGSMARCPWPVIREACTSCMRVHPEAT